MSEAAADGVEVGYDSIHATEQSFEGASSKVFSGSDSHPVDASGDEEAKAEVDNEELTPFEAYLGDIKMTKDNWLKEIICGISVSIVMVPEAVAFSFIGGVSPLVGLQAAWIICLVTALLGGRPAQISGATGAIAVVLGDLVQVHGIEYLFYAVLLMGIIQVVFGLLRIDKLVRMIPRSVMIGFCNGLAIIIGLSQIGLYKKMEDIEDPARRLTLLPLGRRLNAFGVFEGDNEWISGGKAFWAAIITIVSFLTANLFPRITMKVPSSLVAVGFGLIIEWAIARQVIEGGTNTVEDFAGIREAWPKFIWANDEYNMPTITGDLLSIVFPYSIVMAVVGLLESLLTLKIVDELTQTKGSSWMECLGQGSANIICAMLGGMGGCATIGQAIINVNSGARTRVSSITAGIFLLIILLAAYPLINAIPLSALAGVMFNVCFHTFEWESLKIMFFSMMPKQWREKFGDQVEYKVERSDAFTILLVTIVTLFSDLAVAVIVGIIFSCCHHAWSAGEKIRVDAANNYVEGDEFKVYNVHGALFFASIEPFLEAFDPLTDPDVIKVRFEHSAITDFSGLEALNTLSKRYKRAGKVVKIEALADELSMRMLKKAGSLHSFMEQTEEILVEESLGSGIVDFGKDKTE